MVIHMFDHFDSRARGIPNTMSNSLGARMITFLATHSNSLAPRNMTSIISAFVAALAPTEIRSPDLIRKPISRLNRRVCSSCKLCINVCRENTMVTWLVTILVDKDKKWGSLWDLTHHKGRLHPRYVKFFLFAIYFVWKFTFTDILSALVNLSYPILSCH